jgi:acyl carrier protein
MPEEKSDKLQMLTELIKEVKPSLGNTIIKLGDSLVEDLGLDSLDITQLARKVRRIFSADFDPQAWVANRSAHKFSVSSLLEAATAGLEAATAGEAALHGKDEPPLERPAISA